MCYNASVPEQELPCHPRLLIPAPSPVPGDAQEDEAADKRSGAEKFRKDASDAAAEVSVVVARFMGAHEKGCEGLRQRLAEAEQAARSASRELSAAAVSVLEEVHTHRHTHGIRFFPRCSLYFLNTLNTLR